MLDPTATVEAQLRSLGLIEIHEDDVRLDDSFATEWTRQIERIAPNPEARISRISDHPDIVLREFDGIWFVTSETEELAQFISRAAMVADLAVFPLLRERVGNWDDIFHAARDQLLVGLRVCLDTCPVCAGPVAFDNEPVPSRVHDQPVIPYACQACHTRLVEVPQ